MALSSSAYKDVQVSDVKIPWNANSKPYFHFKLQWGKEETRVIFLCLGKLELSKKRGTDFQLMLPM